MLNDVDSLTPASSVEDVPLTPLSRLEAARSFMVAGDWHGNAQVAAAALATAKREHVDCLVQLGSFGIRPDRRGDKFLEQVNVLSLINRVPVFFIEGRNDWQPWLLDQPADADGLSSLFSNVTYLPRGFRWVSGDTSFVAVGGGSTADWEPWWPGEVIAERVAADVAADGHADVMFTHEPPYQAPLRLVVNAVEPSRVFHGGVRHKWQQTMQLPNGYCMVDGLGDHRGHPRDNITTFGI